MGTFSQVEGKVKEFCSDVGKKGAELVGSCNPLEADSAKKVFEKIREMSKFTNKIVEAGEGLLGKSKKEKDSQKETGRKIRNWEKLIRDHEKKLSPLCREIGKMEIEGEPDKEETDMKPLIVKAADHLSEVEKLKNLIDVESEGLAVEKEEKEIFAKSPHDQIKELKQLISDCERQMKENLRKIEPLYSDLGREMAENAKNGRDLKGGEAAGILERVQECKNEICELKKAKQESMEAIVDIKAKEKELKEEAKIEKEQEKEKWRNFPDKKTHKKVETALKKVFKAGTFESAEDEESFFTVARDLLDGELEIKCLAADELGKIGNRAAVPVLLEAARFGYPDLTLSILGALIRIGDANALELFAREAASPKYNVRIESLRGLKELGDAETALPYFLKGLKDDHPEVRKAALVLLGEADRKDAVSEMGKCLKDEETRVRKAAVSALASLHAEESVLPLIEALGDGEIEIRNRALEAIRAITGKKVEFDVRAEGNALDESIRLINEWWQNQSRAVEEEAAPRVGEVESEEAAESLDAPVVTDEGLSRKEVSGSEEEARLRRMTKKELLDLCVEKGLDADVGKSKAEIIQILLAHGE